MQPTLLLDWKLQKLTATSPPLTLETSQMERERLQTCRTLRNNNLNKLRKLTRIMMDNHSLMLWQTKPSVPQLKQRIKNLPQNKFKVYRLKNRQKSLQNAPPATSESCSYRGARSARAPSTSQTTHTRTRGSPPRPPQGVSACRPFKHAPTSSNFIFV